MVREAAKYAERANTKLLYLALRNIVKKWTMPHKTWRAAANQFAILYGDRFTAPILNMENP